ncbi:hypothetical protein [Paenibacillus arenosi]|uniref:DUF2382 domain-containing protein n=1 Tax=Paenibacillus arenosi TaxID=2774142 RepID=A0ABR9AYB8_9BACL|nr:hypothetical protein [Paenibacillus arenosi]MBD8498881.1 hypothetical protein [Paenibacillus arenosi]
MNMLNGKKSYLIRFTALFSKKGYELAFGIDTILDTVRETQYHLSAPAISTYRTLKLDVMKTATKSPYSASSLFGDRLQQAMNVTEVEGEELQVVHAVIVSYLSDIQKHLSGESRLGAEELEEPSQADSYYTVDRGNHTGFTCSNMANKIGLMGYDHSAISRSPVYDVDDQRITKSTLLLQPWKAAEDHLATGFMEKEVDVIHQTDASLMDSRDVQHIRFSASTRMTDVKDIEIETMTPGRRDHFSLLMHPVDDFTDSTRREDQQGHIEQSTDVYHVSGEKMAVVEHSRAAEFERNHWKEAAVPEFKLQGEIKQGSLMHLDWSSEAHASSDVMIDNEQFSSATVSDDSKQGLATEVIHSELMFEGGGTELVHLAISEHHIQLDAKTDAHIEAELQKQFISDSPEIGSMVRLLQIMYGHCASEIIQAGIDNIWADTITHGILQADTDSIKDAVIQQLKQSLSTGTAADGIVLQQYERAASGTNAEGTMQRDEQAVGGVMAEGMYGAVTEFGKVEQFNSGILDESEHGTATASGDGIYQEWEEAERNVAFDGAEQSIVQTVLDADYELSMEHSETGYSDNRNDAVLAVTELSHPTIIPESDALKKTETANYIQEYSAVEQPIEWSTHIRDFDAKQQEPVLAKYLGLKEYGILHEDERARGGIHVYNAVDARPEHGSKNQAIDSIIDLPILGNTDHMTRDSILEGDEYAANHRIDTVYHTSQYDQGENTSSREAVLEFISGQNNAENVLDATLSEYEGMSGDSVLQAVHDDQSTATIGDSNMLVHNEEQMLGHSEGLSLETLVEEDIEADSFLRTDAADIGDISDSTRKKKVIPVQIHSKEQSLRLKKRIDTDIVANEQGSKLKKRIDMQIETPEEGRRHKVIETVIEKPSKGSNITHNKSRKKKIWLILGKVASWSIWNWKKTR